MERALLNISYLSRLSAVCLGPDVEALGFKACQCSFLLTVSDHPGISQDALAREICINKSNVARQAAMLEESGFIRRVPSWEDKRVMQLYPTEKTLTLLPQLLEALSGWYCRFTQDLTPEETQLLPGILEKVKLRAMEPLEE